MSVLMVQGTSSGVGKSLIAAALCRHFKRMGLTVAPFKSQNMSLNSAVSIEGGEMARSQYVQSIACEEIPSVKMNPILLKPETNGSQIIVLGKPYGYSDAKDYMKSKKAELFSLSVNALRSLMNTHNLVVIEGAGSPAEINIKDRDIVNMKVAQSVNAPVILVADIERGGAFAQITGTIELLEEDERKFVKGYIFNKFMGDKSLLEDYPERLARKYDIEFFGTMPYIKHKIPEEDSMIDGNKDGEGDLSVDVIHLPHISNFDDFDPLIWNTRVHFVENGKLEGDIVVIPGTKMTIEDLEWLKERGLDSEIKSAVKRGSYVVGICGGYQMIGEEISDGQRHVEGINLIPVKTEFAEEKRISNLKGHEKFTGNNIEIEGYEVHHGISRYTSSVSPFAVVENVNGKNSNYEDGYVKGKIFGTYFHGLFRNFDFTQEFLNMVRREKGLEERKVITSSLTEEIDRFTDLFESNIDVKSIEKLI